MSAIVSTVKLHLNQREATFLVPVYIAGVVAVISVLISLIAWRSGSEPGSVGWINASQSSPGTIWALAGYFISLGVTSVATTFPFALSLGATRRSFVAGTLLWNVITAAYIAVIIAVLCALEIGTNHWFAGFYIFDVYVLGAGDLGRLLIIVFLGVMACLTIGGAFAASWVRLGARGPQLISVGVVLVGAAVAIAAVPETAAIRAAFEIWWLTVAALFVTALCAIGTWLLLRPAIVR